MYELHRITRVRVTQTDWMCSKTRYGSKLRLQPKYRAECTNQYAFDYNVTTKDFSRVGMSKVLRQYSLNKVIYLFLYLHWLSSTILFTWSFKCFLSRVRGNLGTKCYETPSPIRHIRFPLTAESWRYNMLRGGTQRTLCLDTN